MIHITNKGKGAGGCLTTLKGKLFEQKTSLFEFLINKNYILQKISNTKNKYNMYLIYQSQTIKIIYVEQNAFKLYMKHIYNKDMIRHPDGAFIVEYKTHINILILEKKEQSVDGSVELKLWSAPSIKREYELLLGESYNIYYCLIINDYIIQFDTYFNNWLSILQE
jgi:hypothetical protein